MHGGASLFKYLMPGCHGSIQQTPQGNPAFGVIDPEAYNRVSMCRHLLAALVYRSRRLHDPIHIDPQSGSDIFWGWGRCHF